MSDDVQPSTDEVTLPKVPAALTTDVATGNAPLTESRNDMFGSLFKTLAKNSDDPMTKMLLSFINMLFGGKGFADEGALDYRNENGQQVSEKERQQIDNRVKEEEKTAAPVESIKKEEVEKVTKDIRSIKKSQTLIMPVDGVDGRISSQVGERDRPKDGASKNHKGLDIAVSAEDKKTNPNPDVVAAASGVVIAKGWEKGYGNFVYVSDGEHQYRYGHLKSSNVKIGETIAQGEKLGVMGMTGTATGIHLHFEVRDNSGKVLDPQIMGQEWKAGKTFTKQQVVAYNEAHKESNLAVNDHPLLKDFNTPNSMKQTTAYVDRNTGKNHSQGVTKLPHIG